MPRNPRTVPSLAVTFGLALAVAASAQQAEHRVEVFTQAVQGPAGAPHIMPFPSGAGPDIIIGAPGPHGMPGAVAGHGPDIQAALAGPAGALSTPDMLLRHAAQLDLSDDQAAGLKALHVTMRKMHVEASAQIQLAEIDVEAAANEPQPNMDILEDTFEALAKAQMAERMLPFRLSREAREELTDGQLAKWDEFLAQRHDAAAMHEAHASMMRGAPGAGAIHMGRDSTSHDHGDRHGDDEDREEHPREGDDD